MNLQFLTGNPKKGKRVKKKKLAKNKKKSTIKLMAKKKRKNLKKNPVNVYSDRGGKSRKIASFLSEKEINSIKLADRLLGSKGSKKVQKRRVSKIKNLINKNISKV